MSGSRGPPQSGNRYSDYNDYEYGSSKPPRSKKPQFQQGGRRDFTKPLPGSSSLTHSMGGDEYSGGGRRYGSGSGGSSRGGAYGSYGGSGAGGSGGTGGGGGGYNKPWRSSSQGDLKGGNSGNNSSYSPRISSSNGGPIAYQSLGQTASAGSGIGNSGAGGRYDSYNSTGRNSLSNSVGPRPFGKRINSYTGISAGAGSGSSVSGGTGLESSSDKGRGSDTYYPSRNYNSLSQSGGKGHYSNKYRGGGFKKGKRYGDDDYDQRRDYYAYQQQQHQEERNYERVSFNKARAPQDYGSRLKQDQKNEDNEVKQESKKEEEEGEEEEEEEAIGDDSGSGDIKVKRRRRLEEEEDEDDDDDEEDEDEEIDVNEEEEVEGEDKERMLKDRITSGALQNSDEVDQDDDQNEDDIGQDRGQDEEDEEDEYDEEDVTNKSITVENTIERENEIESIAAAKAQNENVKMITTPISSTVTAKTSLKGTINLDKLAGCIYPLNYMESQFVKLQEEFEKEKLEEKPFNYSGSKDLESYPFFVNNIGTFLDHKMESLTTQLKQSYKVTQKKKISLIGQSQRYAKDWEVKKFNMDQQLHILHPPDDEMKKELDSIDIRVKIDERKVNGEDDEMNGNQGNNSTHNHNTTTNNNNANNVNNGNNNHEGNGRRGRRHGDLVTTEAEFQEILQSLGKEQDEDPVFKAQRVAAKIPDFILDPVERDLIKYMDSNNIVKDKEKWTKRVHSDFEDTFSYEEHELFCEGFCMFPKRFGAISRHIGGLRTAEECVLHYYLTKKAVNYKLLVNQFKKKSNKKNGGRRKSAKSRNVSSSNTPISTPTSEKPNPIINGTDSKASDINDSDSLNDGVAAAAVVAELGSFPNSKPVTEELYTETGRRKRAAAPVFKESTDGSDKKKQRKRKDDDNIPNVQATFTSEETTTLGTTATANEVASVPASTTISESTSEEKFDSNREFIKEEDGYEAEVGLAGADHDELEDKKKAITSYWSITEANMFPRLLSEHGTKWTTIADKLSTKTATMVRNYFQRNSEKHKWSDIVKVADARLDAKFAAVLGQDQAAQPQQPSQQQGNVPTSDPIPITLTPAPISSHLPPSSGYPLYSYPPQPPPHISQHPHYQAPLSIGTFQHNFPMPPYHQLQTSSFAQQQAPPQLPLGKTSSINSLLLNDSEMPYKPYVPRNHQTATATQPTIQSSTQGATDTDIQPITQPSTEPLSQPEVKSATQTAAQQSVAPVSSRITSPPQRSSIMSLLNADSSPIKPPVSSHSHTNSLKSLLNSPPNEQS